MQRKRRGGEVGAGGRRVEGEAEKIEKSGVSQSVNFPLRKTI